MKSTIFSLLGAMFALSQLALAQPQPPAPPASPPAAPAENVVLADPVPPEIADSAVVAVAKLGDEVVLGHFQVAVDRMNPLWKKRVAERMGGLEELNRRLASVPAEMAKAGISMITCKPKGAPIVYQVAPGTGVGAQAGKTVYTKWLVLVPTSTYFRMMKNLQGQMPQATTIESKSFQVAISDKGKLDWTFIDGSSLNALDLRSIFITLPVDMKLPSIEKHEVKQ